MSNTERISFDDLKRDVIDRGICDMCRGCVSFCSADSLHALTIKDNKPAYLNEEACLKCGICYMICPNTEDLEDTLKNKYDFQLPIGRHLAIESLRTKNPEIRQVCTDGGVVTSLLHYLLDIGYIHGAIVSRKVGLWNNQPMVATSFQDLMEGAGSSMSLSSTVEDLSDTTTYVPTMLAIRSLRASDMTRVAFVGTPCQIKTLRKMQLLRIVPAHIVRITIGLFCYENFNFTLEGRKNLEEKMGTSMDSVIKINIKDDFIVKFDDGSSVHLDLDELGDLVRPECIPCTDFSCYTADISVGGIGSPDGYTTTMTRNQQAKGLVEEAIANEYIERNIDIREDSLVASVEKMAWRKYNRGIEKLKQLGVAI
ncbi:MAG: Coenzyme F420 hydrogenase/dehydrogenase, beta subunit C-terminal domain [Thermodesulfovibrionia bacterium]|nr:Coenzyme F420 hydrogenase/dehydrogenase, beta subunit C-terminal domain [Thermodesulfovibrionia bacterium]